MNIEPATDQTAWDAFLVAQPYAPFLQSWTMGEVYRCTKQEPIRLQLTDQTTIHGICQAIVVPARRGRHLAILYGPVLTEQAYEFLPQLIDALKHIAVEKNCRFIRFSPFWEQRTHPSIPGAVTAPLHLLAEHVWYLPLKQATPDSILMNMRKTTRNLIRRAERDGVTVCASENPAEEIEIFLSLHAETRRRHGFTPYSDAFLREQLLQFHARGAATLYLARWQNEVLASSIHVHWGGETSYHHGASSQAHAKIPASYLLQWTAICDALKRGDRIYNFWGIAPEGATNHPFAGVTTFKTGFGGQLMNLTACMDLSVSWKYSITRVFETFRKWRRGF